MQLRCAIHHVFESRRDVDHFTTVAFCTGGRFGLSGQFAAIMEKAGIKRKITQHTKGGRVFSNLSFHSLRHSFNSAMANAGIAQELRQKLTGHTSAETNKVYTHHELEALRAAVSVIPSISGK